MNDSNPSCQPSVGRQGRTFAFLGGAKLGESVLNVPLLQERTERSLSQACCLRACPAHPHCRAVPT